MFLGIVSKSISGSGGGVDFLCLPTEPDFPEGAAAGYQSQSDIFGISYGTTNRSSNNNTVLCSVCEVTGRSRSIMIPAKSSCPTGWIKEYQGLLMSQHHSHSSGYICVATDMQDFSLPTPSNNYGGLYVVEVVCDTLKCPPFIDGYEIGCVLCTK